MGPNADKDAREQRTLQQKQASTCQRYATRLSLEKSPNFLSSLGFSFPFGSQVAFSDGFFFKSKPQEDHILRYKSMPAKMSKSIKPIKCRDGTYVYPWSAPSREAHLKALRETKYDMVVIGGGCVGNGVALDAVTRGLKVAIIERDDFSAGTSGISPFL